MANDGTRGKRVIEVGATALRGQLREVLSRAESDAGRTVILRDNKPVGVVLSIEELRRLEAA